MKKMIFTLLAGISLLVTQAQNDVMIKHNGEKIDVKVVKVGETIIAFKYPGEDAEQTIGKFAVASIKYGTSGRKEVISDKIIISGKNDWEKVQILTDKVQVLGLKQGEEVRGKTSGMLSYNTAGSADKKATKKIKEAAAEDGAPFVLMTSDKNDGFGVKQSIKNGIAYNYN
ncbi:MAG: hypothetical protein ACSLE0_17390 [Chitinophagaceae bacterium]